MKKLIAAALLCGACIENSFAQTEKGTQSLGLSLGVSTGKSTASYRLSNTGDWGPEVTRKSTEYYIAPSYSYFISDKLDISAGISYGHARVTSDENIYGYPLKTTSADFSGSIGLRRYFLFDNKIGIRTGPYFTYGSSREDDQRSKYFAGGLGLDFVYYPSKKIGLAASLGGISYIHERYTNYSRMTNDEFTVTLFNSLGLSFFYVIGAKN
ncbi:hypothetical protein DJ568_13695 [Mucilaginibacter hurinus]|uniref:Outer membrane protein beta-barrel domain-containing protein n=1 Tax=Mucilaginibacter hurinus TaxID=2201324 RepID=A0A367GMT3_9SPHI|nr:hypothetical protein [Mucilaginibacter hurinus]RCH54338.1 hypothetical protein DJ568_13695 [Mucilaginibacter hurinus]